MEESVEKILDDLESVSLIQKQIKNKIPLPRNIAQNINRIKNIPELSPELSDAIKELEIFISKNYIDKPENSVMKIIYGINAVHRKQQTIRKNPVVNLITLINLVSEKKITNASDYVKKLNSNIVTKDVILINTALNDLKAETLAAKEQWKKQKRKIENRIKADIATLIAKNSSKKIRVKEQKPQTSPFDFRYTVSPDGGICIDKYIGKYNSVIIPDRIENFPVTNIGYKAFDNPDLRKIVIPASVQSIVYCAVISQQHLHVLFKGESIQMIAQSFFAPKVTFYYSNNAIAGILYRIADNNLEYKVNYNAADFETI